MKIDIISDVACPWCYIGKKNLEAALAQRPHMEFEVQWFPFQLHPEASEQGYDYRETIARKYGRERAETLFDHVTQAGAAAGIHFRFDRLTRGANTLQAHRLLDFAWPLGKQNVLAEALFSAYFCGGEFIGDREVLVDIGVTVGMDAGQVRDFLKTDDRVSHIREQIEFARQNGVTGVPSFSFDGKFALSGGQPSDTFLKIIDRLAH